MKHDEETRNFLCTDDEIENDDDPVTRGLVERDYDEEFPDDCDCELCRWLEEENTRDNGRL